ncbi:MAG: FliA/WhiG family RNA polymerase sigma factor [Phycisphaerales bacterium]
MPDRSHFPNGDLDLGRGAVSSTSLRNSSFQTWPISKVWREFKQHRTDASRSHPIRNYLLERYLPLVRYTVQRIRSRLPNEIDTEDLLSVGVFGLRDAIETFDIDSNVKFETYCAQRIRGSILDELRSMDWVPRLVRHRTAKLESARQRFRLKRGRWPTEAELRESLQLSAEEFEKVLRDGSTIGTQSITRNWRDGHDAHRTRDVYVIREDNEYHPLKEIQRRDLRELITKGLSRLDRIIVILYYYEGLTMKEIGVTLALSESRISQLHNSILIRLKCHLMDSVDDFAGR